MYGLTTIHVLQTDKQQKDDTSYAKLDLTVGQKTRRYKNWKCGFQKRGNLMQYRSNAP